MLISIRRDSGRSNCHQTPTRPGQLLLSVRYAGDVARAYSGERLLTDNFYNGKPFDIGATATVQLFFEKV